MESSATMEVKITKKDWELIKKSCEDGIKRAMLDLEMSRVGWYKADKEIQFIEESECLDEEKDEKMQDLRKTTSPKK